MNYDIFNIMFMIVINLNNFHSEYFQNFANLCAVFKTDPDQVREDILSSSSYHPHHHHHPIITIILRIRVNLRTERIWTVQTWTQPCLTLSWTILGGDFHPHPHSYHHHRNHHPYNQNTHHHRHHHHRHYHHRRCCHRRRCHRHYRRRHDHDHHHQQSGSL